MRMTDALSHLPAASVRHAEDTLLGLLPPPVPDTPEARAGCDAGAMAHAIALRPADAAELMMAVQIVGTHAHAMECHASPTSRAWRSTSCCAADPRRSP